MNGFITKTKLLKYVNSLNDGVIVTISCENISFKATILLHDYVKNGTLIPQVELYDLPEVVKKDIMSGLYIEPLMSYRKVCGDFNKYMDALNTLIEIFPINEDIHKVFAKETESKIKELLDNNDIKCKKDFIKRIQQIEYLNKKLMISNSLMVLSKTYENDEV